MFGISNFHSGLFIGACGLIAFNTLIQSPTIFLSFFFGVVSSGLLTFVLLCWIAVNGYIKACINFFDVIHISSTHDIMSALFFLANIWRQSHSDDHSVENILRPLQRTARNNTRRSRENSSPQGPQGEGHDETQKHRGPTGAQGPTGALDTQSSPDIPQSE